MREIRNYYATPSNYADHSTFGGIICASDFCTDYEGTRNIANRIASDWKFDECCKKNALNRDRTMNYKKGIN